MHLILCHAVTLLDLLLNIFFDSEIKTYIKILKALVPLRLGVIKQKSNQTNKK